MFSRKKKDKDKAPGEQSRYADIQETKAPSDEVMAHHMERLAERQFKESNRTVSETESLSDTSPIVRGIQNKDLKKAEAYLAQGRVEEAAELGLAVAMGILAERYYFGEGNCPVDQDKSAAWAIKAASAGDRVGQFRLAWSYQYGEGGLAVDYRQATAWFKRAANQGCEASMNNLGYLYKRGGSGILRDMNEALFWFRSGAEAGDIYAQDNLGACYRDGIGVEPNLVIARKWFQRSADGGNPEAQSALGTMMVTGQGGPEDIATGCALWQSSASVGEETSTDNLNALRRLISIQKWRVP